MIDSWINFGEGFLLVFAINDTESFKLVKANHDRIIKSKLGKVPPILIVGNKQDLVNERKIENGEAKALADECGCDYMETSAKTNFNCKEAFESIAMKIIQSKTQPVEKKGKCCIII